MCDYYQFNPEDNFDKLVKNIRKDIHFLLKDFIEYPIGQERDYLLFLHIRNEVQWYPSFLSKKKN